MKNSFYDNAPDRQVDYYIPGQNSYKNSSPERLKEVKDNLSGYVETNPELFTDAKSFRENFNYDKRSPEQKKVLDDFVNTFFPAKIDTPAEGKPEKPEKPETRKPEKVEKNTSTKKESKKPNIPEKAETIRATPSYTDESVKRHGEIISNLYKFYETKPELFIDRPTFEKAFEYSKRSNRQKQWLDTFWDNEVAKNDLYV